MDIATADRLAQLKARQGAPTTGPNGRSGPSGRTGGGAGGGAGSTGSSTAAPLGKRKRRHAAAKSRIAALAMSIAGTGGLATFFAVGQQPTMVAATAPAGVITATESAAAPNSDTAAAAPTVVNGEVVQTRFGPVQVQAVFATDGSLSSVQALQTPTGDRTSISINNRAVPTLNTEALSAQNAQVDSVSGATYTSRGYAQSLQSAIDEARAAGLTDTI